MSRLKVVFVISVVILGVLIGSVMLSPVTARVKYSEIQQEQLLKTDTEWIVEFKILNHEGDKKKYTITQLADGKSDKTEVTILEGRKFTYIYHVYPEQLADKVVTFAIYKEGEPTPFEQITYHIE
jgi:hypothetical protein